MRKKRCISLLLALMLALSCVSFAEAPEEAYEPGQDFEAVFTVSGNPRGAERLRVAVNFDPSVFDLLTKGYRNDRGGFSYMVQVRDGRIGGLRFRVRDNTASGSYPIDITVLSAMDQKGVLLPKEEVTVDPVTVRVRNRGNEEIPTYYSGDRIAVRLEVATNEEEAELASMRLVYDENVFRLEPSQDIQEGKNTFYLRDEAGQPIHPGTWQWAFFTVRTDAPEGIYQITADTEWVTKGNVPCDASRFVMAPYTVKVEKSQVVKDLEAARAEAEALNHKLNETAAALEQEKAGREEEKTVKEQARAENAELTQTLADTKATLESIQEEFKKTQKELVDQTTAFETAKAENASLKEQLKKLNESFENAQQELQNVKEELGSLQNQNASLQSENASLQNQNTSLQSEITSMQSQNASLQYQVDALTAEKNENEYRQAETLYASGNYEGAKALYQKLNGYRDAASKAKACEEAMAARSRREAFQEGKYVTFGRYPQTAEGNDQTPIEWLVLEVQGNKALLLSRYGLDTKRYNEKNVDITWEKSTLRSWLNGTFLNKAFTVEEQKGIVVTNVDNGSSQGHSKWSTSGGNNTQDRVFLLSYGEANKYLGVTYEDSQNTKSRVAPTAYAIKKRAYTWISNKTADGTAAGWWWLRSPGTHQDNAALVNTDGSLYGNHVNRDSVSVRPAVWINLESGIF